MHTGWHVHMRAPVSYTHLDVYKRQELKFEVKMSCWRMIDGNKSFLYDKSDKIIKLWLITLLNVGYMVFSKILAKTLNGATEKIISDSQCRFCKGRLTIVHLLMLTQILQNLSLTYCHNLFYLLQTVCQHH